MGNIVQMQDFKMCVYMYLLTVRHIYGVSAVLCVHDLCYILYEI